LQVCGFECGIEGKVAGAVGKELEGSTKGEDCVNFVDGDALAEFDVLFVHVSALPNDEERDEILTAWVTVEMVCSPDKTHTSFPFFTSPLYWPPVKFENGCVGVMNEPSTRVWTNRGMSLMLLAGYAPLMTWFESRAATATVSLRYSIAAPSGVSRGTAANAALVGAKMVMLEDPARVSARPSTRLTSSSRVLRSGCEARSAAMSPWAKQAPAIKTEDQIDERILKDFEVVAETVEGIGCWPR
jgi:hypothetical protein